MFEVNLTFTADESEIRDLVFTLSRKMMGQEHNMVNGELTINFKDGKRVDSVGTFTQLTVTELGKAESEKTVFERLFDRF